MGDKKNNSENNKEPLVSVIVPCYNARPILDKCMDSLLEQSYKNYELIFIDDCSTDNSFDYTKKKNMANIKK
ncbi:MAG: glycosyltransferase family A protein [Nanoarchaeota archaeon]